MALVKCILNNHEVEYDDSEFEFITSYDSDYLHYIGSGINVTNPKGNTSCHAMFQDYKGTDLDLSEFNTSEITNMSFMFHSCMNLEHLNLSNFNTNKVTDMCEMFWNCKSLKALNLLNFNTSNVKDMSFMFNKCYNLKHLNLSNFNTNKVTNMDFMFYECINLKTLDISSFYIDDTKILDSMFWNCRSLETLKVSSDYLQFFLTHRDLLEIGNNVNIISVSKLDKAVNGLFY